MRFTVLLVLCLMLLNIGTATAEDAPEFELEDFDGEEWTLEDLLEETNLLIIDFWQVGCKPCNELVAHLDKFQEEYAEDDVEFVIISRDTALTIDQVEPYFRANKYSFLVLLDPEQEASKEFEVKTTPATFVITPEGEIIYEHFNYKAGQEKELQEIIEDYLAVLDEDK